MNSIAEDSAETVQLLDQVRQGDKGALDRLLTKYRSDLRQMIAMHLHPKLRPRVDPSDVVQETQLEVVERLDDYLTRQPMPFRLWLRKTAHERLLRVTKRHLAAAKRTVHREQRLPQGSSGQSAGHLVSSGSTPSEHVANREQALRLQQAITKLSESDREVLLMRNFEGLSNQEVAVILNIDANTVSKRNARALLRLHDILRRAGLTESQL